MEQKDKSWSEEFDNWCTTNLGLTEPGREIDAYESLKSFITKLLERERERVVEEIGKLKKEVGIKDYRHYPDKGTDLLATQYNQALDDLLNSLKKEV